MSDTATRTLPLDAGVRLAHAWLQSLLETTAIRGIFLKGPSMAHHALRAPRISSDVDVLVEPEGAERLLAALRDCGWFERTATLAGRLATQHSRTFVHSAWPCDIDVHLTYPGLLADPAEVFDALWSTRATVEVAHVQCTVPSRSGSVLILALHSLRGNARQRRHAAELESLVRAKFTPAERAEISRLCDATGSRLSLAPVLPLLRIPPGEQGAAATSAVASALWRDQVNVGTIGSYVWLTRLNRSTGVARLSLLWRAIWPSRNDLLLSENLTETTLRARTHARIRRLVRGARSLPQAFRALASHRQATSRQTETRWN